MSMYHFMYSISTQNTIHSLLTILPSSFPGPLEASSSSRWSESIATGQNSGTKDLSGNLDLEALEKSFAWPSAVGRGEANKI